MVAAPSPRLLIALRALDRPYICRSCRVSQRATTNQRPPRHTAPARTFLSDTSQPENKLSRQDQKKETASRRQQIKDGTASLHPSTAASKLAQLTAWELTVGIEIHAELNTAHKLFSQAATSLADTPNTHVAPFDAALPGAQPVFQTETLLPAVRAAVALGCHVQRRSSWDRKHYFWWDQPNGYQITQYYEPFARDGEITLYQHDDIDPADGSSVTIGIKQIQMEQDTAKTTLQPPATNLLDFNRVSHPLIEIITLPQIHSPKTAAALVKKVQSILKAVDANTTGMEMGGLRADVNVSVRRRDATDTTLSGLSYGGVTGLGQRTEIKNLNSFKAVEDAISAERDRQIALLESGGVVEGETRGWTIGGAETHRIRGKEGEVDYRYMPDPDLGSLIIGQDLIDHLTDTLPPLPDQTLALLTTDPRYGITEKDAKTLIAFDGGDRLEYYMSVVHLTRERLATTASDSASGSSVFAAPADSPESSATLQALQRSVGVQASNFLLHELGALLPATSSTPWAANKVTPSHMAQILLHRLRGHITGKTAKQLLWLALNGSFDVPASCSAADAARLEADAVTRHIHEKNLRIRPMPDKEYLALARQLVAERPDMAHSVRLEIATNDADAGAASVAAAKESRSKKKAKAKAGTGKIKWFVGQMLHRGDAPRMVPDRCERAVRIALAQTA